MNLLASSLFKQPEDEIRDFSPIHSPSSIHFLPKISGRESYRLVIYSLEKSLKGSFVYLLHGLSLIVQTTDLGVQERSQNVTDLGTDVGAALACLDSWHQKVKNIVAIQAGL